MGNLPSTSTRGFNPGTRSLLVQHCLPNGHDACFTYLLRVLRATFSLVYSGLPCLYRRGYEWPERSDQLGHCAFHVHASTAQDVLCDRGLYSCSGLAPHFIRLKCAGTQLIMLVDKMQSRVWLACAGNLIKCGHPRPRETKRPG